MLPSVKSSQVIVHLLPDVSHDVVDVGLIIRAPILCVGCLFVGRVVSLVVGVSLDFHPVYDHLHVCSCLYCYQGDNGHKARYHQRMPS